MTANRAYIKRIKHYLILKEVGSGGLGKVYKAYDTRQQMTVAVKMLHDKFVRNRKFLGIFHREMLIFSRLHHKNIVGYLDSHFEPPDYCIVTDYIEGTTLYNLVKKQHQIPPLVALCVAIEVLQGIDYLHLHDVLHSDLSASNVMLSSNGRVVVMDFGLACQIQIENYKNFIVGTPGYYSPEHVSETPMGPPTDLYCVGLLLFEMIVGTKAVPALKDRNQILKAMGSINFKQINTKDRRLSNELIKLMKSALAFYPSRRYLTSEDFMLGIYKILKQYNIRFSRYAIYQYLLDQGLTEQETSYKKQNIYVGF